MSLLHLPHAGASLNPTCELLEENAVRASVNRLMTQTGFSGLPASPSEALRRFTPNTLLHLVLPLASLYFFGRNATSVTLFSSSTKSTAASPLDNVSSLC